LIVHQKIRKRRKFAKQIVRKNSKRKKCKVEDQKKEKHKTGRRVSKEAGFSKNRYRKKRIEREIIEQHSQVTI